MTDFTATRFRFEVEALTPLSLDEYTGSTLRGALVQALQNNFCPDRSQTDAEHQSICPVCCALSHESSPGDSRRPYAIEPLLGDRRIFRPGERFQFRLTLFRAVNLFPIWFWPSRKWARPAWALNWTMAGGAGDTGSLSSARSRKSIRSLKPTPPDGREPANGSDAQQPSH